jgi:uncharacterized membrane protein YhhN
LVLVTVPLVVLGVALCLLADVRGPAWLVWLGKPLASAAFVGYAAWRFEPAETFDLAVLAGLALGAVGDLLLIRERTFDLGLLAFLLGHVAYVVAFVLVAPPDAWPLAPLVVLAVVAAVTLRWLWPHLGRRRGPVVAYVAAIVAMTWGGLALSLMGAVAPAAGLAVVLFLVSDLLVARHRFVRPQRVNRVLGLPMYYAAQLLLASLL